MNEIILNKKASIERCVQQIQAYYALDCGLPFAEDYLLQDAIGLNLQRAGIITLQQMRAMQAMVGFRNVMVHDYQNLNLDIMVDVIENHLQEPLGFANVALNVAD